MVQVIYNAFSFFPSRVKGFVGDGVCKDGPAGYAVSRVFGTGAMNEVDNAE